MRAKLCCFQSCRDGWDGHEPRTVSHHRYSFASDGCRICWDGGKLLLFMLAQVLASAFSNTRHFAMLQCAAATMVTAKSLQSHWATKENQPVTATTHWWLSPAELEGGMMRMPALFRYRLQSGVRSKSVVSQIACNFDLTLFQLLEPTNPKEWSWDVYALWWTYSTVKPRFDGNDKLSNI